MRIKLFRPAFHLMALPILLCSFSFWGNDVQADSFEEIRSNSDVIYADTLIEYAVQLKMSAMPDPDVHNQAILNFRAEHDEATFLVFNLNGVLEKEELFYVSNGEQNTVKMDLSEMRTGTYYIVHDQSKNAAPFNVQ